MATGRGTGARGQTRGRKDASDCVLKGEMRTAWCVAFFAVASVGSVGGGAAQQCDAATTSCPSSSESWLSDVVRQRYEELPYPRHDDVKAMWVYIKDGPGWISTFARNAWGGAERFDFCDASAPPRILLPGCGTGNAMVQATVGVLAATANCPNEPAWEVVCMDLSSTSLAVARQKAAMLGFDDDSHVLFVQKDLLQLDPTVDGVFDLISSTGVLHHLEDPPAGFRALQRVLRRGGAMEIMVYATHGREKQDLFRVQRAISHVLREAKDNIVAAASDGKRDTTVGRQVEEAELRIASQILDALPADHPHASAMTGDGTKWEGVADRYMHPRERAYQPVELFALAQTHLTVDKFASAKHYPENRVGQGTGNASSITSTDDEQEMASMSMELHWRDPADYDLTKHFPSLFHKPVMPNGLRGKNKREWNAKYAGNTLLSAAWTGTHVEATLTPQSAAQLADLLQGRPPSNHNFYLITPQTALPPRYTQNKNRPDPKLKPYTSSKDMNNAYHGPIGKERKTESPFGPRHTTDFEKVAMLNDNALRTIGMVPLADSLQQDKRAIIAGTQHEEMILKMWDARAQSVADAPTSTDDNVEEQRLNEEAKQALARAAEAADAASVATTKADEAARIAKSAVAAAKSFSQRRSQRKGSGDV